jgi:hypothetical protein
MSGPICIPKTRFTYAMIASSSSSPAVTQAPLHVDPRKREHGDFGGAAADVDDHVRVRARRRESDTDRARHRFFDQVHLAAPARSAEPTTALLLDGR